MALIKWKLPNFTDVVIWIHNNITGDTEIETDKEDSVEKSPTTEEKSPTLPESSDNVT